MKKRSKEVGENHNREGKNIKNISKKGQNSKNEFSTYAQGMMLLVQSSSIWFILVFNTLMLQMYTS